MVVARVHRRAEDGHDKERARVVRGAARVEVALLHARDAAEHRRREQEDEAEARPHGGGVLGGGRVAQQLAEQDRVEEHAAHEDPSGEERLREDGPLRGEDHLGQQRGRPQLAPRAAGVDEALREPARLIGRRQGRQVVEVEHALPQRSAQRRSDPPERGPGDQISTVKRRSLWRPSAQAEAAQ